MKSILNRLLWTIAGTVFLALIGASMVTWHMVEVTRGVDATLIGGGK